MEKSIRGLITVADPPQSLPFPPAEPGPRAGAASLARTGRSTPRGCEPEMSSEYTGPWGRAGTHHGLAGRGSTGTTEAWSSVLAC